MAKEFNLACDAPSPFMEHTRQLLRNDERGLLDIHKQSNIPFYWLRKFAYNEVPNPSVNRVCFLYTFLTGEEVLK